MEDCRHLSARLERDLLAAGQVVVRVPPKMMAEQRRTARTRGKSDPIDALAVARAVLREPGLPQASHDEASRELKLLVNHRDDLVKQRTQVINRFRWHLHRIDPTVDPPARSLDRAKTRAELTEFLVGKVGIDARLARELLEDIGALTTRINALAKELTALVADQAPALLELSGCGALTAAKILGETAGINRFADDAKYAMHAGVAPIPVWSGRTKGRVRVNKSGKVYQVVCAACDYAAFEYVMDANDKYKIAQDASGAYLKTPVTRRCPAYFRQIRDGKLYGPSTPLKPENITLIRAV